MAKAAAEGKLDRFEPRCKICQDESIRKLVNKLLAMGLSRSSIVDALETFNIARADDKKITYANLYRHQKQHFDRLPPGPSRL